MSSSAASEIGVGYQYFGVCLRAQFERTLVLSNRLASISGNIFTLGVEMPVVIIKLIRGALSKEQKARMLHLVTEAIVAVEGEAIRPGVTVFIEESVHDGEWSAGGRVVTIDAMECMRRGENPWP